MRLAYALVLACGCSSSGGNGGPGPIDAPYAIDGIPRLDAPAATGPVSVAVRDGAGSPVAGAPVASQLVNGLVLAVATTGTDGTAIVQAVDGGAITVGFVEERTRRLVTIMGVTFGQSLLFRARLPRRLIVDSQNFAPPANPPAGTAGYLAQIPCRFGGQTVAFTVSPQDVIITDDCYADGRYSAAVTAVDAAGNALAYSTRDGVLRLATPIFTGWNTDVSTFSLTLTHATACADCARLDTFRRTATNLRYTAGGAMLSFAGGSDVVLAIPHAPMVVAPETGVVLTVDLGGARAVVRRSTTDTPGPQTIDLAQLLPPITAIGADPTGSRLRVEFAAGAATLAPLAALIELSWRAVDDDGGVDDHRWTVLTRPPAGGSVALPLLPAELGTFAPVLPGDVGDYVPSLTLFDDTAFASFAELAASDWEAEIGGNAPARPGTRTVILSSRP